MTINTHCALRLGDNLAAVHFLRKLSLANPDICFVHHAHAVYIEQLLPLIEGVNVSLCPLREQGGDWWTWKPEVTSLDLWKNTGDFWESHPQKNDYAQVMIEFFKNRSALLELDQVISKPDDLLFDYPQLKCPESFAAPFDFLVINSTPMSGQARMQNPDETELLIRDLDHRFKVITTKRTRVPVTCTEDLNYSVTDIGRLSQLCKVIVMISTGPSWPTFNIWANAIELRIIIIDKETINLAKNTIHRLSASGARQVLEWKGFL